MWVSIVAITVFGGLVLPSPCFLSVPVTEGTFAEFILDFAAWPQLMSDSSVSYTKSPALLTDSATAKANVLWSPGGPEYRQIPATQKVHPTPTPKPRWTDNSL